MDKTIITIITSRTTRAAKTTNALNEKIDGDLSEDAAEPLVEAADPDAEVESAGGAEEGPELVEEALGEPAGSVPPDSVVPPTYPDSQVDYSSYETQTDSLMTENSLTEEQLAKGNEPKFNATLDRRGEIGDVVAEQG